MDLSVIGLCTLLSCFIPLGAAIYYNDKRRASTTLFVIAMFLVAVGLVIIVFATYSQDAQHEHNGTATTADVLPAAKSQPAPPPSTWKECMDRAYGCSTCTQNTAKMMWRIAVCDREFPAEGQVAGP